MSETKSEGRHIADSWLHAEGQGTYVLADRIDAALRRAKAEGMREAAIRAREFSKPYSMEWWRTMTKTGISAAMCRDVADALDARAAQIEEGA